MMKEQNQNIHRKLLKCFAISDYHQHFDILEQIAQNEQGDVFIHGGDFTYYGQDKYFDKFIQIMGKLKFRYKIIISRNHQIILDDNCINPRKKAAYFEQFSCKYSKQYILNHLKAKGCIYLQHQSVNIEGINFFGSPYTQYYCGSSFQYDIKYDQTIWSQIPNDVDVLITHCPPYKIHDRNTKNVFCGSKALQKYSKLRKPKFHLFGHIHQARGHSIINNTCYANIAMKGVSFKI